MVDRISWHPECDCCHCSNQKREFNTVILNMQDAHAQRLEEMRNAIQKLQYQYQGAVRAAEKALQESKQHASASSAAASAAMRHYESLMSSQQQKEQTQQQIDDMSVDEVIHGLSTALTRAQQKNVDLEMQVQDLMKEWENKYRDMSASVSQLKDKIAAYETEMVQATSQLRMMRSAGENRDINTHVEGAGQMTLKKGSEGDLGSPRGTEDSMGTSDDLQTLVKEKVEFNEMASSSLMQEIDCIKQNWRSLEQEALTHAKYEEEIKQWSREVGNLRFNVSELHKKIINALDTNYKVLDAPNHASNGDIVGHPFVDESQGIPRDPALAVGEVEKLLEGVSSHFDRLLLHNKNASVPSMQVMRSEHGESNDAFDNKSCATPLAMSKVEPVSPYIQTPTTPLIDTNALIIENKNLLCQIEKLRSDLECLQRKDVTVQGNITNESNMERMSLLLENEKLAQQNEQLENDLKWHEKDSQAQERLSGHTNPAQKLSYWKSIKSELLTLRQESSRIIRDNFQLQQCIKYLAATKSADVLGKNAKDLTLSPSSLAGKMIKMDSNALRSRRFSPMSSGSSSTYSRDMTEARILQKIKDVCGEEQ